MEKQLLKRIEGMEDNEREKLRELLKDSKQGYVIYLLTYSLLVSVCNTSCPT